MAENPSAEFTPHSAGLKRIITAATIYCRGAEHSFLNASLRDFSRSIIIVLLRMRDPRFRASESRLNAIFSRAIRTLSQTTRLGPTSAILCPRNEKPSSSCFRVNIPPFRELSFSNHTKRAARTCDSSMVRGRPLFFHAKNAKKKGPLSPKSPRLAVSLSPSPPFSQSPCLPVSRSPRPSGFGFQNVET